MTCFGAAMNSKSRLIYRVCIAVLISMFASFTNAKTIYVEPADGSPSGTGTFEDPYQSLAIALDETMPGDTVQMRGGRYFLPQTVRINKSGEPDNRITLMSYPGEWATLDGSEFTVFDEDAVDNTILRLSDVAHWSFKNFSLTRAPSFGIWIANFSNNILFENMRVHRNGNTGVQISSGANNILVLNVDSYQNFDRATNGQDSDGFAAKFFVGENIVFRACRAWGNSDDGWDFWMAGPDSGITVENSYAYKNGYDIWDIGPDFEGDGNGFKLGRDEGSHVLRNNLSWGHPRRGFDDNSNTSGVTLYNNTAYNNEISFRFDSGARHVLRNNLAFGGTELLNTANDDSANSWNSGVTIDSSDFVSLDDSLARGERNGSGNLPISNFLKLRKDSDAVDRGEDVGLSFNGRAPDLGAIESDFYVPRVPLELILR